MYGATMRALSPWRMTMIGGSVLMHGVSLCRSPFLNFDRLSHRDRDGCVDGGRLKRVREQWSWASTVTP